MYFTHTTITSNSWFTQERVLTEMNMLWMRFKGCWAPGQKPLLHLLPRPVQQDIAMEDMGWILANTPFFKVELNILVL